MKSSHLRRAVGGFTIVELIIVITVIGILLGITVVGYSGLQERSRDTERKADVEIIQSTLETYRDQTGQYPSQAQAVTNATTFFPDHQLPEAALVAPGATSGTTSSLIWGSTTDPESYGYHSAKSDNSDCLLATDVCTKFTLTYKSESDSTVQSIQSKYGQS